MPRILLFTYMSQAPETRPRPDHRPGSTPAAAAAAAAVAARVWAYVAPAEQNWSHDLPARTQLVSRDRRAWSETT